MASATKLKFGTEVSLADAANAILTIGGDVTFMLEGEPGIGKSSLLKVMKAKLEGEDAASNDSNGELLKVMKEGSVDEFEAKKKKKARTKYAYSYMDCTTLDLGDIAMPKVVQENGVWVTNYAPNARFRLQDKQPVVIMLDELTKAPEPVKNMLLPLIQERRLGDVFLEPGSIVFATGNLSMDGVGDTMKAHAKNRMSMLKVKKPRAFQSNPNTGEHELAEWGLWAMNHGIAAEIIAWTKDYPQTMASYTDGGQDGNPYIFHPQKQQNSFVSPRSLEKASAIVKARKYLGPDVMIASLAGTVGEAAARDLQAFTSLADKLPGFDAIIRDPKKAQVPDDPAAMCMIVFNCVMNCEKANFDKVMEYIVRMKKETQALFALSVIKSNSKQSIAMGNKKFTDFAMANQYLFG